MTTNTEINNHNYKRYDSGPDIEEEKNGVRILHAFPSTLFALDVPISEEEQKVYLDVISENLYKSSGHSFSQTKGNLHLNEKIKPLTKKLKQAVSCIIEDHYLWAVEGFRINQMWANSFERNQWILRHTHPNSHLSGIFYIDANIESGGTIFLNPNQVINHIDIQNKSDAASFSWAKSVTVAATRHRLILFPSYLDHFSEPNRTDRARITISFNVSILEPIGNKISLTYAGE